MQSAADSEALPAITALPSTTVKQLGSTQVILDPHSVVKELIENALDARAKSIFVDISANTLDTIQVKDDGHGIPAQDRPLVCRRYCTSKIRNFDDLKDVGNKWLGFRGEALASVAEMSGALSIITRVEGEPAAVTIAYDRKGQLTSSKHYSHPVGTTVKVSNFFQFLPVRKQAAPKNCTKWLVKIRRLLQAYALARPSVRFRLHVLKAKSNKIDLTYAPKPNANTKDAAFKVISKDCALQCDWFESHDQDFSIYALLPRPNADVSKIANHGAFLSIDSRPVASTRGTSHQIVTAFKEKFRRVNSALQTVRDPFLCINIICPNNSYDINIEPAKDDVLFENKDLVLNAMERLLSDCYSEDEIEGSREIGTPISTEASISGIHKHLCTSRKESRTVRDDNSDVGIEQSCEQDIVSEPGEQPARWRSTMYGIDENDLKFLSQNVPSITKEEDGQENGRQATVVSNPWTIARMNTTVNPKSAAKNQLLSPAKSEGMRNEHPNVFTPVATSSRASSVGILTPQASPQRGTSRSSTDRVLSISAQVRPGMSDDNTMDDHGPRDASMGTPTHPVNIEPSDMPLSRPRQERSQQESAYQRNSTDPYAESIFPTPPTQETNRNAPKSFQNRRYVASVEEHDWLGQYKRKPTKPPRANRRRQKHPKKVGEAVIEDPNSSSLRIRGRSTSHDLEENGLYSEDHADIRDFFGRDWGTQRHEASDYTPSFTPINPASGPRAPQNTASGLTLTEKSSNADTSQTLDTLTTNYNPPFKRPRITKQSDNSPETPQGVPTHNSKSVEPQSRPKTMRKKSSVNIGYGIDGRSSAVVHYIQNLVLIFPTDIPKIIQSVEKFNMPENHVPLMVLAQDAYGAFTMRISQDMVMGWCIQIDDILDTWYERHIEVDVVSEIKRGINKILEERSLERSVLASEARGIRGNQAEAGTVLDSLAQGDNRFSDFDFLKVTGFGDENVDPDVGYASVSGRSNGTMTGIGNGNGREEDEDEFDGEIDDVMLMDL